MSQISQENICVGVSFLIKLHAWGSNTGVFLWNWDIFKNTFFKKHLRATAYESFLPWFLGILEMFLSLDMKYFAIICT